MSLGSEIETVIKGDSEGCIVCGDCLDIMADMPDGCVDAVVKKYLQTTTASRTIGHYEKPTSRQPKAGEGKCEDLARPQGRNRVPLPSADVATEQGGNLLRNQLGGDTESVPATRPEAPAESKLRQTEWPIQERKPKHALSADDCQGPLFGVRREETACGTPQEWAAPGQSPRESTNTLCPMPQSSNQATLVEMSQIVVITDPPYGVEFRGNGWDKDIPEIAFLLPKMFDRVAIIMGTIAAWQFPQPK